MFSINQKLDANPSLAYGLLRMLQKQCLNYSLPSFYRVLLTRARQGMIIVVPEGDQLDKTRDSEKYDPTWNYLKEIGIDII